MTEEGYVSDYTKLPLDEDAAISHFGMSQILGSPMIVDQYGEKWKVLALHTYDREDAGIDYEMDLAVANQAGEGKRIPVGVEDLEAIRRMMQDWHRRTFGDGHPGLKMPKRRSH